MLIRKADGYWGRLDPRVKLVCIFSLALVVAVTPGRDYEKFVLYTLIIISLGIIARIRLKHYIMRFVFLIPMLLIIAASLLLFSQEQRSEQIIILYNLVSKTLLTFSCFGILVTTVSFPGIIKSLEAMKFPRIFTSVLEFAHRYVVLFQQEAGRMITARKARTYTKKRSMRDIKAGAAVVPIFLFRVLDRSQRIYIAMLSRGYTDVIPGTTRAPLALTRRDYGFTVIFYLLLTAVLVLV